MPLSSAARPRSVLEDDFDRGLVVVTVNIHLVALSSDHGLQVLRTLLLCCEDCRVVCNRAITQVKKRR